MGFMKEQIIKDSAYQVETTCGTETIPFHVAGPNCSKRDLGQYCEGTICNEHIDPILTGMGYVYRLSASGYLDCTSWGWASTEPMAIIHLREMFGDDEESEELEA